MASTTYTEELYMAEYQASLTFDLSAVREKGPAYVTIKNGLVGLGFKRANGHVFTHNIRDTQGREALSLMIKALTIMREAIPDLDDGKAKIIDTIDMHLVRYQPLGEGKLIKKVQKAIRERNEARSELRAAEDELGKVEKTSLKRVKDSSDESQIIKDLATKLERAEERAASARLDVIKARRTAFVEKVKNTTEELESVQAVLTDQQEILDNLDQLVVSGDSPKKKVKP
jgi:vacuolar-type H+-ATPase subunit I/STV1